MISKPYPKYKASGVEWLGDIPEHWEVVKLKNAFYIYNGSTPESSKEEYWDGEIVWYTPEDLGNVSSKRISNSRRKISNAGFADIGSTVVPPLSIIISTRAPIGHIAITSVNSCTNQGCRSLVLKNNISSDFYYYYLLVSKNNLNAIGKGTTFVELGNQGLGSYPIPLPHIQEQQLIAAFLDRETAKIDSLIAKKQKLIKLLKEKRTALISHAVTKGLDALVKMKPSGVEWLGDVPEHWVIKKFTYDIGFQEGPGIMAADFMDKGIPLLRIRNIQGRLVDLTGCNFLDPEKVKKTWNHFRCKTNDLLISGSASTGLVCEVTPETQGAIPYTGIIRLWPAKKTIEKLYIRWLLSSDLFESQITIYQAGSTIKHFGPEHLHKMILTLPPLSEQQAIAAFLECETAKIDSLIAKVEKIIEKLKEYRTALISAAVTGKIDVREGS